MTIKINSEGILVDYIKTLLKDKYNMDSHSSYFDFETHKYLGEYLRELRDKYNINLMAMYNLYTGKLIDDYRLKAKGTGLQLCEIENTNSQFDLIAIPIKPNQTYTLFFDTESKYPIYVAGVVFDGDSFISLNCLNPKITYDRISTYSVMYNTDKNLYMIIQAPTVCSYRVVLEGDYTHNPENIITAWRYTNEVGVDVNTSFNEYVHYKVMEDDFVSDDKRPIVLTSELVSYLLDYCITPQSNEDNILLLQNLVESDKLYTRVGAKYTHKIQDSIFDDSMRKWLYDFSKNFANKENPIGLVDKDTEQILFKGVLNE